MASKVYFTKAAVEDGEKVISEKGRKLFRAGGFASCFQENDFTAVKVYVLYVQTNQFAHPETGGVKHF